MNKIKNDEVNAANIADELQAIEKDIEEIIPEKEIKDYTNFAFKGRMMEMAVAFIVGAAFQKTVEAISNNLLMPFINYFVAKTGTDWRGLTWAPVNGMTLELGKCMGTFLDFFLISLILYVLYVKLIKGVFEGELTPTPPPVVPPTPPPTKNCGYCMSKIDPNATRCPNCTSYMLNL